MKKIILLLCIALIAMTLSAVTWQVALVDYYGDGWNGGLLSVEVNGTPVLSGITLASGAGPQYHDFWVEDGDEVTTTYTPGSWASENYYAIFDHTSALVAESGGTWESPGDTDPVSITTPIIVSAPVGAPGLVTNPSPANAAVGVAPNGTLTWNFGADTDTYELWFGPAGNMTMVDSGTAGATGSYSYSNLLGLQAYNWRVIAQNSTREVTQGPLWSFTTQMVPANVPYNEGFEAGNTDQTAIAGWIQEAVTGTNVWTANTSMTDYNRTPRTGSWNAYLRYGNTRWMFKAFNFEAGVAYEASLFARQDGATAANASIAIAYGTEATAAGMTNSILPATGIINGDYQYLNGVFTVPTTGTYYVGILGTINYTPWYISLDDITVDLAPTEAIFNISPTEWNFGSTLINSTSSKLFTITNAGVGTLTINTVAVSGDYFALAEPFVTANLGTGESATFTVNYNPSAVGTHTGTVTITDARAVSTVDLEGTCYDPTQPLPYTQDFNGGTSLTAINWAGDMYIDTSHGTDGSNGLYINLWSSVPSCNAITPPIGPMITNAQLKFDYRFVNWDSYPANATPLGAGDNLQIQVSTDDGASYTTVYTIDQSNHVTSTSFANVSVSLAAYTTGSIMIRFLGTRANGDYYLDIDNVIVQEAPTGAPNPVTLHNPANEATGLPQNGFNLTWTPAQTGGTPTYYGVFMSQDEATIYEDVYFETTATLLNPTTYAGGPSSPITFNYEDRWYWTVQAINDDGDALVEPAYWFDIEADPTVYVGPDTPWTEGFEGATFPPAGWSRNDADGDGQNWFSYNADGSAHTGLKSAASASWTSTIEALSPDNWLITPPIAIPATGEYLVEYYVGAQDPDYPQDHYGLYISTTGTAPADFSLLFEETLMDGAWYYRSQNLASYAGQTVHFAFRHFDSYDWFYMKIDDVTVRELPETPTLAISPTEWDFGSVQLLNPTTPKSFSLSNVGAGTIDILAGDIQLTGDVEGNFVLVANNLPVPLSGSNTYTFTVQFIPQSLGTKTATVTVEDNLTRVLHTIELSGECVEEPIASVIALQGAVETQVNVRLNWASIYGDPTQAGYVHWDDSIQRGNVGAGATPFHAVAKYGTEVTALAAGKVLDGVMIHIAEEPQLITSVKVWTGTDADLTPVTMVHEETVSGLTVGWNYVALTTPVPITGTDAIYVGYLSTGMDAVYPASNDGLTAVNGRGNVLEIGGSWTTLTSSSIAGSWLIHAHFAEAAPIMAGRRPIELQNVAVNNIEMTDEALRNSPIKARMNGNVDRVLRGFNVYRDGVQINSAIVAAYTYLDEGLAADTYDYAAQAVHYSANGPISGTIPVTVDPPADPIALPFLEDWESASYETNLWSIGSTNWVMDSITGNPAPSASFSWSPRVYDYNSILASYEFDATGIASVQLSFDLNLNNYDTDAENTMTWEVWNGTTWNTLGSYSSLDDDLGWTTYAYDISAYAANRVFKIRFVAAGEDSYSINYWNLDNIYLAFLPATMDPITDLSVSTDGLTIDLNWTAVPNATWYMIYASEDPYGTFLPLGFVPTAGASLPTSALPTDKAFVKVTAGTGPFPAGLNLSE